MIQRIPLTIATRNPHKAREIAQILPPEYEVHALADYPAAPEVEETGRTFAANAALKACRISAVLPGLVLADDSGLCVDALGGYPGVLSARYAGVHGDDAANNAKLLRELRAMLCLQPFEACFMCAMCLAEGGREEAAFLGRVDGRITLHPRGTKGFGYDPLFIPSGYDCTMAELPAEVKNRISHRADALRQFADWVARRRQA